MTGVTLLFYCVIACGVVLICMALSLARKRITNLLFNNIVIQPQSSPIVSKMHILAMAFLETPFVLSVVTAIINYDLLFYENFYISFLPIIYVGLIFLSSAITIYYSGKHIGSIVNLTALHPQYESKLMIQLFLFLSTLQAPFIILFVILLYNKYNIINNISIIFFNHYFLLFIFMLGSMLLIMQYSLCQAISTLIFHTKTIYEKYPAQIGQLVFLIIMHMGFFQAPYIFSFIVFIILSKFFTIHIYGLYAIFSLLGLLFGITGSIIIYQSGKIVHTAIKNLTPFLDKNKKIMQFALISQVILDSRILYLLLIILFALNFF